jgi:hypothetical protein
MESLDPTKSDEYNTVLKKQQQFYRPAHLAWGFLEWNIFSTHKKECILLT